MDKYITFSQLLAFARLILNKLVGFVKKDDVVPKTTTGTEIAEIGGKSIFVDTDSIINTVFDGIDNAGFVTYDAVQTMGFATETYVDSAIAAIIDADSKSY